MMPRRDDNQYQPMNWPTAAELGIETGLVEMMTRDNARMRKAGCNLAEAAGRVVRDYDGLHRLSIAISAWFSAVAGEGDRDTRHSASVDRSPEGEKPQALNAQHESAVPEGQTPNTKSGSPDNG